VTLFQKNPFIMYISGVIILSDNHCSSIWSINL